MLASQREENPGTQVVKDIYPDSPVPSLMVSFLHYQGPDIGKADLQMKIQSSLELFYSHK